jgi:leucyl-tRNA synthetase
MNVPGNPWRRSLITPDPRFERLTQAIYLSLQREWIVLGTHQ